VLTGPFGNNVPFARSDNISDTTWGFGDLAPMFQLKWNAGVHNYMTYITGDIPVGAYQSTRLSNIGIGHGAIDAGGGYTYFNPQTGHEFSGVLGFTYNTKSIQPLSIRAASTCTSTGVHRNSCRSRSWLASWAMSIRSSAATAVSGDRVGCFQSQVVGIGPRSGFCSVGDMQGYLNLKAYGEFAAENRPAGWNNLGDLLYLAPAPGAPPTTKPIVRKY